ncbi:hypothetical protein DL764_006887 [Monosporascus ibericus]|uniref:histidine kinase n=1 Tax=Monosporascus ibericus TaxID=155417 RepID=A0A4Q4T6P5_9PEZI|nr:hypothetical protein DL764_006887 [Monosporascus ibericus]
MRIRIREQLAALVLIAVLLALAVISIPVWMYVNGFVVGVKTGGLSLTASLKAAQVSSELEIVQTACRSISTRLLLQEAFKTFYEGNETRANWEKAAEDLRSALNAGPEGTSNILQARLYSRNETGAHPQGLVQVTGTNLPRIILPYKTPNGSDIALNDTDLGYPPELYPNITYVDSQTEDPFNPGHNGVIARPYPDIRIASSTNGLILGPLVINETYALISYTLPIRQNNERSIVLGFMTVVAEATSIVKIMSSEEGLGETGSVLLIGPATGWNRFSRFNFPANSTHDAAANFSDVDVKFVLPPKPRPGQPDRHARHSFASGKYQEPFKVKTYDAAFKAFTVRNREVNNASSMLSTTNEEGVHVAVGYARPQTILVNWTLIVEQDRAEAYVPINTLRNILLGCVFSTVGLIVVVVFPIAHLSVMPIRRLKTATKKSMAPPGYEEAFEGDPSSGDDLGPYASAATNKEPEKGLVGQLKRLTQRKGRRPGTVSEHDSDPRRRRFKIPGKVAEKKHYIRDELTELTATFNEMVEELTEQYSSLESKVAERTHELEQSKKAAEAANESKTLFIANISHELKTPLNGILGMCSVCMEEDDLARIKQSLKIGQQLSLEEREFRLGDIRSQILTIFDKQVREGAIDFSVHFIGPDPDAGEDPDPSSPSGVNVKSPAVGPNGAGRLKDMCLWGDQHRILQVLINLVSNSLKFTPKGGKVSVRMRCMGEVEQQSSSSRTSSFSKASSNRPGRPRHRVGSNSNVPASPKGLSGPVLQYKGTALSINPLEPKHPHVRIRERSPTPPPPNAKTFVFEFEVEDTGPGIPEQMQEKVFEPFVQGDLGLSKKFGGTGLGLSICQQLAHLMGGTITLKSTVGFGTTFRMHIPLKYTKDRESSTASSSIKSRPPSVGSVDGEARRNSAKQVEADAKARVLERQPRLVGWSQPFFAANPTAGPKPSADDQMKAVEAAAASKKEGKLRVLVADDNKTNVEVVTRMLKFEDVYDVTIAKDGQEAYDLVKADMEKNLHFDLIFMDVQMPNLDGLQSTRLIRKMGYSAPIVALTAFAEESNVRECMESGMDEFLSKPIRRPALKQVLQKFATIPEEPETSSNHDHNSTEAEGRTLTSEAQPDSIETKGNPHMNGTHQAAGPPS